MLADFSGGKQDGAAATKPSDPEGPAAPPSAGVQPESSVASLSPTGITVDEVPGAIKVGLLLPLSGKHEQLGRDLLNAAQMALFDLAGDSFVVFPFDTKGTAAGAAAAAEEAVRLQVGLVLGPLLAPSVSAAAPIVRRAGISIVAFSNSRNVAGDGVFIVGFVPQQQVEAIVDHAIEQGLYRHAVLAPNNAYGHAVVEAFRAAVTAREGTVVRVGYYNPRATDLTGPAKALADYDRRHGALLAQRAKLEARKDEASKRALRRLERLDTLGEVNYDAVLLPARGQQLKALASLLSYYDVGQPAVRLLGLANWAETSNVSAEPSLNHGWYAAPPRDEREKFFARYRELYHREPAAIASLAYDATALAVALAQRQSDDPFTRARLTQNFGFIGVDGLFRLRTEGAAERVFEVREVTRRGFIVRKPAPKAFPVAGS